MKFNLKTERRKLYLWRSENPFSRKKEYPGWKRNGGIIPSGRLKYHCFACTAAWIRFTSATGFHKLPRGRTYHTAGICEKYCPVKWPGVQSCNKNHGSLWSQWKYAVDAEVRSKLALGIMNLEWIGETDYQI